MNRLWCCRPEDADTFAEVLASYLNDKFEYYRTYGRAEVANLDRDSIQQSLDAYERLTGLKFEWDWKELEATL